MTDPQLVNNNNNQNNSTGSSNNYNNSNKNNKHQNNHDEEPKYRHKKFKKMATSEDVIQSAGPIAKVSHEPNTDSVGEVVEFRKSGYVCPYCNLACAKPSVLQKHIRAHTNERPYPCVPCGFAFKTKSNLYKHCRSRAHALKMEGSDASKILQVSSQLSDDSDVSLSDSASNSANTPPPTHTLPQSFSDNSNPGVSSNLATSASNTVKIYKPKFHTALHDNNISVDQTDLPNAEQLQQHIERIINDNQTIVETLDPRLHKLLHRQQSLAEVVSHEVEHSRKRCYSEGIANDPKSEQSFDHNVVLEQQQSPGPSLGNTRLIDVVKQPRLVSELSHPVRPNAIQMFGGEVQILDKSGKSKTMRIERRLSDSGTRLDSQDCSFQSPETAAIVVRSSLHSGGTMLHQLRIPETQAEESNTISTNINLSSIAPNISTPSLAPIVSCLNYLKQPANILHAGRIIPYVPGIPGPQNLSMPLASIDTQQIEKNTGSCNTDHSTTLEKVKPTNLPDAISGSSKFLRPSSLPLKPGTFTPKRHHGITPTAHTLPLISPETPRPKKTYGQLYLNGHAYTYLGLKCSTKLFYCTLNRPQPMYVRQQHGLSMYSNWKICKDVLPSLEFAHYDSRHRPAGYTLAQSRQEDILTHSSQRPNTPLSPDNGPKSDCQEKTKRSPPKVCSGGFKSTEDYTYIRGRGRGRYVCEECGIRCKKPSMLKKHIRTHTDVRPYTCKYCTFSFKTKGNLTKHMKSKSHYKKCVDLKILPVPTNVEDDNIDKDALNQLTLAGVNVDDMSSSEEENEHEAEIESDESDCEEHEAAQSLLRLSQPHLPGLVSSARPATYPYSQDFADDRIKDQTSNHITDYNSRISVIRSCNSADSIDEANSVKPIDLTTKQNEPKIEQKTETIRIPSEQQFETSSLQSTPCTSSEEIIPIVSGAALLQTIVPSMERLPIQGHDWPVETTEGRMLQAYLTERHMMDRKLKQQCRITVINKKPTDDLLTESILPVLSHQPVISKTISEKDVKQFPEPVNHLKPPQQLPLQLASTTDFHETKLDLTLNKPMEKHNIEQTKNNKIIVSEAEVDTDTSLNVSRFEIFKGAEFLQPTMSNTTNYMGMTEDARSVCNICNKVFNKPSQLRLHINIHYFERPFRCESCGISFRTKGHLTKHERSTLHHNKVSMTSTFGAATASNPRPFKCTDCESAFRIHGHLAKHLRSKMHIMKLECLRKLPFGTYAEMERSGMNLNDIDTTDCNTSLASLQVMAQKLCAKDSSKLVQWDGERIPNPMPSSSEGSSDEGGDAKSAKLTTECNDPNLQDCNKICDKINSTDVKMDEIVEKSSYKCQLCPVLLQSLSDLHVHCFVEHKIELDNDSVIAKR